MKEIKAIIQPQVLDQVLEALHAVAGIPGCTVSRVEGYARSSRKDGDERIVTSAERVKLELVVPDKMVEKIVELIHVNAKTGHKGDGKIFIIETKDAVAIRTGERGEKAL